MLGKAAAKAIIGADNRRLGGDLKRSRSMFSSAFGSIGKGIKGALSLAMSPLGVGAGALGFASMGSQVMDFEAALLDVQVQGNASAKTMAALRSTIGNLSEDNAQAKGDLAGLALEMVNLEGVAGLSAEKLTVLADASFATSAPVQELAGLSLALGNSFKLVDPTNLKSGLDAIIVAGKAGSIPLGEMNILLQQSGAEFSKFSGAGIDGATKMAATLQTLRKQAGSAGEAGTRLSALLGVFQTREVELKKYGIRVKDLAGNYREVSDIVADIDATGIVNDAEKYVKAFGKRKEGRLALETLISLKQQYAENLAAARKGGAIDADIATRRTSDAHKIKKAFNDSRNAMLEAFTPARIKAFASLMERMAVVLGYLVDHAIEFGAMWAAFKVASFVSGFSAMAASSGVMTRNTATMVGAMGKIGQAAQLAGVAIAGWQIGTALDQAFSLSDRLSGTHGKKWKHDDKTEALHDSGYLRDRAGDLRAATAMKVMGRARSSLGLSDMGNNQEVLKRSLQVAFQARSHGLVGDDGIIDRKAVFRAQTGDSSLWTRGLPAEHKAFDSGGAKELREAIEQALRVDAVASDARSRGLKIKIEVDERGLLKARAIEERDARRSP